MTLPEKISADHTLRPSELASVLALLKEAGQRTIVWDRAGRQDPDRPTGRRGRQPPLRRRPGASARPRQGHGVLNCPEPRLPVIWFDYSSPSSEGNRQP